MCMLGAALEVKTVPRGKAIGAVKRMSRSYKEGEGGRLQAACFTEIRFFLGRKRVKLYEMGGVHRTVKPTWGRLERDCYGTALRDPEGNGRGFWAYKSKYVEREYLQGTCTAAVLLWGRVVIHEKGYRAEFCKVVRLL